MNSKGIILFDIDRTIFDTNKLSVLLESGISKVIKKASVEEVRDAKKEFVSSLSADREFDPENLITFLCQKFDFYDRGSLMDVYYSTENKFWYKDLVFPEVYEIIKKLKSKYRLGVYSEGTKRFQNYKFNSMGISNLLDKDLIYIFEHKTNPESIFKIPKEAIIIDDKESVCEYLADNGFKPIWLNNKDDGDSNKFTTIHSLTELPKLLL